MKARAPNSPVVIVGTHCDVVQKTHPTGWVEQLGLLVERRYMPSSEPDKFGLPRVLGHFEVSCRGRLIGRSLRSLADFIFNVAVNEHLPGNLPDCIAVIGVVVYYDCDINYDDSDENEPHAGVMSSWLDGFNPFKPNFSNFYALPYTQTYRF